MMCTLILHRLSGRSITIIDTARPSLRILGLAALLLPAFPPGALAQTFGGSNPITISGTLDVSEGSTVSVTGLSSTVTDISLTFTNLNVTNLNSVAAVLVPPSGSGLPALDLMSGVCGSVNQQIGNSTFTMVSNGGSGVDNLKGMIPYFGGTCPSTFSGSYVPTDYYPAQDKFNSPGPSSYVSGGIGSPGTTNCNNDFPSTQCGTYNFDSAFELPANGAGLNGTWTLYIANEAGTGQFTPSGSLGSWSITFTTENAASTTTSVSAGPDGTTSLVYTNSNVDGQPATGTPVTITATVSPNPGGGTVTFYDSTGTSAGSGTVLASAVAVNSLGEAQTTVTFPGFEEGSRTLSAAYGGVAGQYTGSTSGLATVLTTNHPYNPSGATFCNGPIKINDNSGGTPYPSLLALGTGFSQLQGTIESVTVTLNNVNLQNGVDLDDLGLMLQAPGSNTTGLASSGNAFEFLSWAGNPYTSGTLTISDTGTAQIPYDTAPPCTNCLPTDNYLDIGSDNSDSFPAPAPATFGKPAPTGSSTFTTEFGGQGANNTWSLYADNRLIEGGTLGTIGSWCLNFTMQANAHPTAMTVNGSPNPASITSGTTANVSLTATISVTDSSGLTVNAGTVTFVDGSTNLGTVAVSNGVATLNNVRAHGRHASDRRYLQRNQYRNRIWHQFQDL